MRGLMRRARRLAAPLALLVLAVGLPVGVGAMTAGAQQGPEWNTNLRYSDGKEIHWRATPAKGCDGSNVELRLVNNSQSSGTASLKDITFTCVRPGTYVGPERTLGQVAPGGVFSAPVLNCACAEKGGVKELMSVNVALVRNGESTEALGNGCTYTGNFVNGERNGKGIYTCTNGYRYEGNYTFGQINGPGLEKLATGETYEGLFVDGEHHGLGKMTFNDGSIYEGNFVHNKRDGTGTQKFKDGSVYIGEWKSDQRVGSGVYTTADQQWTYDGGWANNLRNGDGKLLATDGSYTFIGKFENDKRTGQGIANFGDGRVFRGTFANDQQIGPGELTFKDGRKITGDFKDHRPHGHAIEVSNVATIDGAYVDGLLQGKAVVTYATGDRFEGPFTNSQRNGIGVDTRKDGSKEECNWVNDVRQQPCTQITRDGKRIEFRQPAVTKGKT